MSLQRIVEHYKMRDMSGKEIQNLIGKPPVLYSDLKNYKSLNALLGKENYAIILYQTSSKTEGHFVAITRNDYTGKVRYADSYGIRTPDMEIQFTPYDKQLPRYLTQLLDGVDYESNTVDYQSKKTGVSTCGRWSSLFCAFRNIPLASITEMMKMNQDSFLKDTDNIAVLLTLMGLDNIEHYLDAIPRGRHGTM